MPPLSTHFRLAVLVMRSQNNASHAGSFLLGTTAPDAFEPENEASFTQHHFKGGDGQISLQDFLQATNFLHQSSDDPAWSFTCGYYCHLWLDVFYGDSAERLHFKRPSGMPDADLRSLIRKESEILNAPFVLKVGSLPSFQSGDLLLPSYLEFVNLERCVYLFHEVVTQSRAWSVLADEFASLDPIEYGSFIENASQLFVNEIQTVV